MLRVLVLSCCLAAGIATASVAHADVVWLCMPGEQPNPCRESNETTVYESDGSSRVENPPFPADPPIDCFFVYPTVSGQPGTNANKDKDDELFAIARYQAARFSQQCRVFAPIYRQLTLASIYTGTPGSRAAGAKLAYGDVREAWNEYLAKHSRGRGVALIGHSQGTRMLRQLVREEIDPKPEVRRRLVSALLLGGNVLVRKGRLDGGDFQNVPACTRDDQTGCVIAFSTFNEPPPSNARFGRAPAADTSGAGFPAGPDYEVLCTNPASLAGNTSTPLTTYVRSEPFPGSIGAALIVMYGGPPPSAPTPWLQPADRYRGRCVAGNDANVFMIEPIGSARRLNPSPDASWGLHLADVNIALGELVGLVGSQARAYLAKPARECLPRRGRIEPPRIGRLRLGRTRNQLEARVGIPPVWRGGWASRWCTQGDGRLYAVFQGPSRSAKAKLLFSATGGYRVAGLAAGARLRAFLRRFPDAVSLGRRIYRAAPRSTLFFAIRGRQGQRPPPTHVDVVGVASPRVLSDAWRVHKSLFLAGLIY